MSFSEETMKALRNWLGACPRPEQHPADEVRFCLFVAHVWRERKGLWDESEARGIMRATLRELHPDWRNDEYNERFLEHYEFVGTEILDFLSHLRDNGKLDMLVV